MEPSRISRRFCGRVAVVFYTVLVTASVVAEETNNYQLLRLLKPTDYELKKEEEGQVFIYEWLQEDQVEME